MSLTEVNLWNTVKKQLLFKLKAYSGVFTTLVVVQSIAILFSFGAVSGMSSVNESFTFSIRYYTGDVIISFTLLWAFISAILITTKAYRNDDFTFVTSRLTSNVSNALFLLTASIVSGIAAILASLFIKVMALYFIDIDQVMNSDTSAKTILIGLTATMLYIFLISSLGYMIGMLVQFHKLFAIVLTAIFFGSMYVGLYEELFLNLTELYTTESSLFMFLIKVIVTVICLHFVAIVISNRLEVK